MAPRPPEASRSLVVDAPPADAPPTAWNTTPALKGEDSPVVTAATAALLPCGVMADARVDPMAPGARLLAGEAAIAAAEEDTISGDGGGGCATAASRLLAAAADESALVGENTGVAWSTLRVKGPSIPDFARALGLRENKPPRIGTSG